jgi:hypothetical protein
LLNKKRRKERVSYEAEGSGFDSSGKKPKLFIGKAVAVSCYNVTTELFERLRIFSSLTEAASLLNLNSSVISSCCMGKKSTYRGLHWAYYEGPFNSDIGMLNLF